MQKSLEIDLQNSSQNKKKVKIGQESRPHTKFNIKNPINTIKYKVCPNAYVHVYIARVATPTNTKM